jgi:dihydroflavonol-4-reductase
MIRALVTGSTGCVGSNLVAALNRRGVEVRGLWWNGSPTVAIEGLDVELIAGDVLDIETLRPVMDGVDWVFHVAGIADDWNYAAQDVYRTNVQGTYNVLSAAWEAGVKRFVLTSSAASLGMPREERTVLDESYQFNVESYNWVYGHSKYLAEQVMAHFVERGLHAVSVLPTIIMGRGDLSFVGGQIIARALKGQVFPIPEGGTNYIDVRDVAQAHIAAAEKGKPGERYLLGGHNMTHQECLETIGSALDVSIKSVQIPHWALPPIADSVTLLRKLGAPMPIERGRVLLSGKYLYYDNRKAVRELGLTTRPFHESIQDAFRWYNEHGILEKPKTWLTRRRSLFASLH